VQFLDIIKGFQEQRLDTPRVIASVCSLFRGHDSLLQGFNSFLPGGHRMPLTAGPPSLPPSLPPSSSSEDSKEEEEKEGGTEEGGAEEQMQGAMVYMDRVRDTFVGHPSVYFEFLSVMKAFQGGEMGMNEVMGRVGVLFRGHEVLLQGFNCFLPPGQRMPAPPAGGGEKEGGGEGGEGGAVVDAMRYMDRVRELFSDRPPIYMSFLDIMKMFQTGRLDTKGVIREVGRLFHGHEDLLQGFNAFLPKGHTVPKSSTSSSLPSSSCSSASVVAAGGGGGGVDVPSPSLNSSLPSSSSSAATVAAATPPLVPAMEEGREGGREGGGGDVDYAVTFVGKVKERFASDPARYQTFLEVLLKHEEGEEEEGREEGGVEYDDEDGTEGEGGREVWLARTVSVLFEGHPDLLDDFSLFLPERVQRQLAGMKGREGGREGGRGGGREGGEEGRGGGGGGGLT